MASDRARLEGAIINRFNADARPLSPGALELVIGHLAHKSAKQQDRAVKHVLEHLDAGAHRRRVARTF